MSLRRGALSTALAVLAACVPAAEQPLPPPPAAEISSFTASPAAVAQAGDPVTLQWAVSDATSVSLEQTGVGPVAIADGATSATAPVSRSCFFVLTARGEGGTDSRALAVHVQGSTSAVLFSALPARIEGGRPVTLVWSAPGAQTVALEELGGAAVDLAGQREAGAVTVVPARSTTYRLTVDGKASTAEVTVVPVISSFTLDGDAPAAGAQAKLVWKTAGATKVTITRAGASAPVATVTDPAQVAAGDVTDTVPAGLPVDGLVTWSLDAEAGGTHVTKELVVRVGGRVRITSFSAPGFLKAGQTGAIRWTTRGGDALVLSANGLPVFVAASQAEVNAGTWAIAAPASPVTYELVVRNARGDVARTSQQVSLVDVVQLNSVTITPPSVSTAGGTAQITWDVTNARRVRVSQVGGGFTAVRTGVLDTGTIVVVPNRPQVTYRFEADNGAGDAIAPQALSLTVTTPLQVTVSRKLPPGLATQVTGTTAPVTAVYGLPTWELDRAGEAFVDIADTGTEITFDASDTGKALLDIGDFDARLFGAGIAAPTVSVSTNGWLVFSPLALTGPTTPSTPVGTSAEPLAVLALWRDLVIGSAGKAYWQVDTVGAGRRLIVQWTNFSLYGASSTRLTFQAQVFESGKVVLAYQTLSGLTGTSPAGVVNAGETAVLGPSASPLAGQTVTLFAPVSTFPVAHTVQSPPYWATVEFNGHFLEALLDDALALGDVAFTELNPRPLGSLTDAEWIEVANFTSQPVDLEGWTLSLGAGTTHTIASSAVVPANGRALLAQSSTLGDGFTGPVAYTYPGSFALPDTGALALLPPTSSTAYARIDWTAATAPAEGVSVRADRPSAAFRFSTSVTAPTCPSTTGAYGTSGQTGTPGAGQARCFTYTLQPLQGGGFEPIAATGTRLVLASDAASDETVYAVTLPQPVLLFGAAASTLYVSTNGWLSTTLTTAATPLNRTSPSSAAPVGSVAPYWDALIGSAAAGGALAWVQRDPDGTAASGDEVTIVSWEGFRAEAASTGSLSFQAKLFGNGNVEFHYGDVVGTSALHRGSSATSWLENPAGTTALAVNVGSATAPGIAASTGFRYLWSP